jgi:magnesium-protoporphyrin O-methyltransferase
VIRIQRTGEDADRYPTPDLCVECRIEATVTATISLLMDCCSPGDSPFDRQFDERHAAEQLRAYRKNGPGGTTRTLIEALSAGGVDGQTVLDIGGGVGAVHHELVRSGAGAAVDVDASRAYITVARKEAERQGHADRVRYLTGDFVADRRQRPV